MKRIISVLLSFLMIVSVTNIAFASEQETISSYSDFNSAIKTGGSYSLIADISRFVPSGVSADVCIEGNNQTITYATSFNNNNLADSMLYQNENVNSSFSNLNIVGKQKLDTGLWVGAGSMTLDAVSVKGFNITSGRCSAITVGNAGALTLNNTSFDNNSTYDINVCDSSVLNINDTTSINSMRVSSNYCTINIGDNWSGKMLVTYDRPVAKTVGTVGKNADISGITVTNDNYYFANENGALVLKKSTDSTLNFDMSQRELLYKGSTGFLYGSAEINVPSIDLLAGLKPDTMVQKAMDGKQHPTGDAIRTRSALLASGVKDMQIYLQDHFLEWPYDMPMKNGTVDLDSYQKTVESILYKMICKKSTSSNKSAFRGSDGNYYELNKSVAGQYSYVLFNEPDQIWYGGNLNGLEQAWKRIYNAVHIIDSNARCVGPNYSGFNKSDYDHFLKFCYDNNCLPEIISWHELGDISLTDFYSHYDDVMANVNKYYDTKKPQIMVNEYARHYDIGSCGGLVKWLAMFENKDMSGCMAYWAMANSLNELAADQNSPTSSWWVYHWYAMMTGEQCPMTYPDFDKTRFYGLVSYDEKINMAYALFGGNEDEDVAESVKLDNIDTTNLLNANNAVNVKLYGVRFSGQHGANYSPEMLFDGAISTVNNTLEIKLDNADEMDAFFAVVTKPNDNAVASKTVDAKFDRVSYEAENAKLLGNAQSYKKIGWTDFATSGRIDVGSINNNGDGVEFTVDVSEDGDYIASLFYSLQSPYVNPKTLEPQANGQNRGIGKSLPYGISVDGVALDPIILESTILWAYKNHCDTTIHLTKGEHKITYTHINGDQSDKGNLQLVAALDKLDIIPVAKDTVVNVSFDEMSNFKENNGYRLTVVAPKAGYYNVRCDSNITLSKQCVDYAKDAKSTSECSVYDASVGDVVYLSQGANTLVIAGEADEISFVYDSDASSQKLCVNSTDMSIHGFNPVYKTNMYASSGKTVANIGVGQKVNVGDSGEKNYASFTLNVDSEGLYNFAIRYTNDEPAPIMQKVDGSTYIHPYNIDLVERYAQISVNSSEPETVYFRNTFSWDTFKIVDVQLYLKKGNNVVKIYNDNSYQFSSLVNSTSPEIDTVTVSALSYNSSVPKLASTASAVKHNYSYVDKKIAATNKSNGVVTIVFTCKDCQHTYSNSVRTISRISSVALLQTKFTYDGKNKKPSVAIKSADGKVVSASNYTVSYPSSKNVGKYTVKVIFNDDYSGTYSLNYVINPKNTSGLKLTAQKKAFKASWKKSTDKAIGYQIRYSTKSNMSGAKTVTVSKYSTTSKTISKLSAKKKYYVQIRTYKTVKGTKYYSSWSGTKSITTKK